jgi:hypothetical protein
MGSSQARMSIAVLAASALASSAPAVAATPPEPPPDTPSISQYVPTPPPPDTPSISQYVEQVPTSHGGSSPGVGKAQTRALPPVVANRLRSHRDVTSQKLKKVATSTAYGAPQQTLSKSASGDGAANPPNALSAAVSSVNDLGGGHVAWLLVAIVLVTTVMVWSAVRLRER